MRASYHGDLRRAARPLLCTIVTAYACGPGGRPAAPIGSSRAAPAGGAGGRVSTEAEREAKSWDKLEEVRAWGPVNEKSFVSLGHPPGTRLADVHVSPDAREAYLALGPGTELPVGSVVAEFQRDGQTGQPGLVYAMHKIAPSRWDYSLVEPDGRIREQGNLPLCARCHSEAVADQLFGLPASQ
jgi:hypothetical protein